MITEQLVNQIIEQRKEPDWLINKRLEAWKIYNQIPFPSKKEEEWKYIDLSGLETDSVNPSRTVLKQKISNNLKKHGIIFTDLQTALKENPDLVKKYFSHAVSLNESKFSALHYSLLNNGVFVYVPSGVELTVPLHNQIFALESGGLFNHTIIVLEPESKASFIEEMISPFKENQALHTENVEIFVKDGANLKFLSLQSWGQNVYDFAHKKAIVSKDANLDFTFALFGSKFTKLNADMILNGEGCSVRNYGIYFGIQDQDFHMHTSAYQKVPHTKYEILNKGVLLGRANAVHKGLIKIENKATQANGFLTGHTLLLSEEASSNIIPSLEIDNNDVQAGHAATVGQVDELQLFYLMSRGLDRKEAERLIVSGYFEPIISKIGFESLKENIQRLLTERIRSV